MGLDRRVLFRLATSDRLERGVKRVPGGEPAAWRAASRYVAGRSRSEALAAVERLIARGHAVSLDLFGERVTDPMVADRVVEDYRALAADLPPHAWLSVDLSHLALDADRLAAIADTILGCVLAVAGRGLADRLGATVQANLLRTPADAETLADAGVHVRLVKGAYVEPGGAHPFGEPTDLAFLRLGHRLAGRGAPWSMATHDGRLREALLLAHGPAPVEHLFGVRPEVLDELHDRGVPTRAYVPYGPDWFRYWARRVAESRGA